MGYTSSEVKNRYNKKVYTTICLRFKKDLVATWKEQLQKDGLTQAEFIRTAIENYLAETKAKN